MENDLRNCNTDNSLENDPNYMASCVTDTILNDTYLSACRKRASLTLF